MTGFPSHILPDEFRFRRTITSRDLPKTEPGHCRWCGKPVVKPRRSWCSDACVNEFNIRFNTGHITFRVWERDKGVCAICGLDCQWIFDQMTKRHQGGTVLMNGYWLTQNWGPWRVTHSLWEADHIVPVIEGGGCCGLENYRTLCQLCHKKETAALKRRLSKKNKEARK